MKLMGVDYGEKRIGLAVGDSETKLAIPYKVATDMDGLISELKEEKIDAIVIGIPFKSNGLENGYMEKKTEQFIRQLLSKYPIKVHRIDERLSSKGADSLSGDRRTKASRDALAAMLILQAFFDYPNPSSN